MFSERNFRDFLLTDDNIDLIFGKKDSINFSDVDCFDISVYTYDILEHHPMVKFQLSCKNYKIIGDLDKCAQPQKIENINNKNLNEDIELGVEIIKKLLDSLAIELEMIP